MHRALSWLCCILVASTLGAPANSAEASGPWNKTTIPSDGTGNGYYIWNNGYELPGGGAIYNWSSTRDQWGGYFNFYGKSGGTAVSIMHGRCPWGGYTASRLMPMRVDENRQIYSEWSYTLDVRNTTRWNTFWEIWVHDSGRYGTTPGNISLDIMIHPDYASIPGDDRGTVTLDGVRWQRKYQSRPDSFDIIHYRRLTRSRSTGLVHLNKFWWDAASRGWCEWDDAISSVTAGLEGFNGAGYITTSRFTLERR